jgi:Mn-containing catalase
MPTGLVNKTSHFLNWLFNNALKILETENKKEKSRETERKRERQKQQVQDALYLNNNNNNNNNNTCLQIRPSEQEDTGEPSVRPEIKRNHNAAGTLR